jgi:hypothetical protein
MSTPFNQYFLPIRRTPVDWDKGQKFLDWYLFETANFVNARTIGIYSSQAIPCGKQLQLSNVNYAMLRKTLNFGVLPNSGSNSVAHNIVINSTTGFRLFNLYLAANDTTGFDYFCLQYWSVAVGDIVLSMDATDVTVATQSDYSNFDTSYVVIEYALGVT